jgi:hypothetical protein
VFNSGVRSVFIIVTTEEVAHFNGFWFFFLFLNDGSNLCWCGGGRSCSWGILCGIKIFL